MSDHSLKIMQILPALNHGGVELCVLENSAHIATYGTSLVVSSGGCLVEVLLNHGAQHFTLPIAKKSLMTLRQIKPLRALIEQTAPDIIHVHSRLQAWLTYFALKGIKKRPQVLSNVHGFNSVNFYSKKMLFGDQVLLVSNALKDYVVKSYPDVDSDKMHVIPLGVEHSKFNESVRLSEEINQNLLALDPEFAHAKIIMLPGRITRIKGHEYLVRLLKRLKSDHNNIKGLIVGAPSTPEDPYYKELKNMIKAEGLEHDLYFYGTCDNMPALYRRVHCTLSLTIKPEAYGRTVLESLACKTPVVGFDYGGVAENLARFFPEGRVTAKDEEALYQRTQEILAIDIPEIPVITDTLAQAQQRLQALYQSMTEER